MNPSIDDLAYQLFEVYYVGSQATSAGWQQNVYLGGTFSKITAFDIAYDVTFSVQCALMSSHNNSTGSSAKSTAKTIVLFLPGRELGMLRFQHDKWRRSILRLVLRIFDGEISG
ncbi:hypothetical protein ATCC90586_007564 [Pythium insidiosum]|nr:hypothetical protein ATCC90586_007564 [Pythium insidiosum]